MTATTDATQASDAIYAGEPIPATYARLRVLFPEGSTVHTVTRHRSASNVTHWVSPLAVRDGNIFDMSGAVARVLGRRISETHGGVKMSGGNISLDFELVYSLAFALYGDGYALHQRTI